MAAILKKKEDKRGPPPSFNFNNLMKFIPIIPNRGRYLKIIRESMLVKILASRFAHTISMEENPQILSQILCNPNGFSQYAVNSYSCQGSWGGVGEGGKGLGSQPCRP